MIIALLLVGGLVAYVIMTYNGLQSLKTQITASIQEIGNQLKRQVSLIPNLQEATKGYLKHEKGVYELITNARAAADKAQQTNNLDDVEKAINQVQAALPQLRIMVESNPELKANTTVEKFMSELTDTADKLMYARRSLIDLTQNYNQKLVVFPSNFVAQIFGFKPEKGLATATTGSHVEVSSAEMEDVKVKLDN